MNDHHLQSWLCWINALLLAVYLAGCGDGPACQNVWMANAALAIAEAEQTDIVKSTGWPGLEGAARNPRSVYEEKSGASPRLEPDAKPRKEPTQRGRRILYFGSKSCPACGVAEASLDRLAERGWKVGPAPDSHIQTVMIDATREERKFAQQWDVNSVPTWIVWENGREAERRTGVLDPFEIGRLFGD